MGPGRARNACARARINDQDLTTDEGWLDTDADGAADCVDTDDDGDGIVDGNDPDVVADVVSQLPTTSFSTWARRTTMLNVLDKTEALIAAGDIDGALDKLYALRRRVDGCNGTTRERADRNDWITDCDDQRLVRGLIDDLIDNLLLTNLAVLP